MRQSDEQAGLTPRPSPGFAGLLAHLTRPAAKTAANWLDEDPGKGAKADISTLSYERALRLHARYRPVAEPKLETPSPTSGQTAGPAKIGDRMGDSGSDCSPEFAAAMRARADHLARTSTLTAKRIPAPDADTDRASNLVSNPNDDAKNNRSIQPNMDLDDSPDLDSDTNTDLYMDSDLHSDSHSDSHLHGYTSVDTDSATDSDPEELVFHTTEPPWSPSDLRFPSESIFARSTQTANPAESLFADLALPDLMPDEYKSAGLPPLPQAKSVSITLRVSPDEAGQLRLRAREAGLTVSAYLRSCTFEAEALRAQVKEALAELRQASVPPPSHSAAYDSRSTEYDSRSMTDDSRSIKYSPSGYNSAASSASQSAHTAARPPTALAGQTVPNRETASPHWWAGPITQAFRRKTNPSANSRANLPANPPASPPDRSGISSTPFRED